MGAVVPRSRADRVRRQPGRQRGLQLFVVCDLQRRRRPRAAVLRGDRCRAVLLPNGEQHDVGRRVAHDGRHLRRVHGALLRRRARGRLGQRRVGCHQLRACSDPQLRDRQLRRPARMPREHQLQRRRRRRARLQPRAHRDRDRAPRRSGGDHAAGPRARRRPRPAAAVRAAATHRSPRTPSWASRSSSWEGSRSAPRRRSPVPAPITSATTTGRSPARTSRSTSTAPAAPPRCHIRFASPATIRWR